MQIYLDGNLKEREKFSIQEHHDSYTCVHI